MQASRLLIFYATGYAIQSGSDDSHIFKAEDDSASGFEAFQSAHQQEEVGGYQVQENEHQYYPQEALQQQQHYQYVAQEQDPQHQGLSNYYSYPQEALQQSGGFHHQPIIVDEQEKS